MFNIKIGDDKIPTIHGDPAELALHLPDDFRAATVLGTVRDFFKTMSLTLARLSGWLMVEALVGEMTDIMERIRWNCLED